MADIKLIDTDTPIKNGSLVSSCTATGFYNTENTYVNNKPIITDIETKYSDKFDDPSYYYGNGT
jgi:hypothetical protein